MDIYNYLFNYFNESPFIIQVMWILIGLFVVIIIILIFQLRRLRKGLRVKARIAALYEKKYESYILNYLYSGNDDEEITTQQLVIISQLKNAITDSYIRKILISLFVKLKNEISGEIATSIEQLYSKIELEKYALARLYHKKWYVIAKGIRELNQFHIRSAHDEVAMHINHPRREVRKEMQLYMVNLFYFEGLNFLNILEMQLSDWDQIQILGALRRFEKKDNFKIKSWLESRNDSVILFALKLAEIYNKIECTDDILNLLNHENRKVRIEAIRVLGCLNVIEAKEILKLDLDGRTVVEQIIFFKMLENLYESSDEPFVLNYVNNENFEIKVSALKILKAIDQEKFDELKVNSEDEEFSRIINFIDQH